MRDNAFIKFKTPSGDDIFVNSSRIITVEGDEGDEKGSRLRLTNGVRIAVSTTMAEIEMLLDVYSKEKQIEKLKFEIFKQRQQNLCDDTMAALGVDGRKNNGKAD